MRRYPWLCAFALSVIGAILFLAGGPVEKARAEQGCADGYTPQPSPEGVRCQPIPGLYRESGGGQQVPQGHWETRWGAFAASEDGTIGLASTRPSEDDAVDNAVAHCTSKGGKDCRMAMTWYNQCAVVAAGEAPNGKFNIFYYKHYTIKKATKVAMKQCTDQNLGGCKVYFSDCSKAEFVR
ncbi:DUF4189 domain-containing protein [Sphingopyxis sp.]|uniref:DUF4189 domain-containing protein n=1 Tax=Sphingopyxis sp. TaxID=1908224 RepID=UPI002EDB1DD5